MAFGIMRLFWGGVEINIKPGGSLKLGGVVGSPVIYGTSVDTSNKMAESEIKVKAMVLAGQRVSDLYPAGVKQEAQVHCDSGQTFVFPDTFRSGTLDITSGDNSEVDLTFHSGVWVEI